MGYIWIYLVKSLYVEYNIQFVALRLLTVQKCLILAYFQTMWVNKLHYFVEVIKIVTLFITFCKGS